jgi:hypothetical protein
MAKKSATVFIPSFKLMSIWYDPIWAAVVGARTKVEGLVVVMKVGIAPPA